MRERLRRRRVRERATAPRSMFCEAQMYSGLYYGARCVYRATYYNQVNDVYVCGIHKRAYTTVVSIASIVAWNEGRGPSPWPVA